MNEVVPLLTLYATKNPFFIHDNTTQHGFQHLLCNCLGSPGVRYTSGDH